MPFPYDRYPWLNFQELNLAYFIKHFREIFQEWNTLYHDLTEWKDATDQELEEWKTATMAGLDAWKTITEQGLSDWETLTTAALDAWKAAFEAEYENLKEEAEGIRDAAAENQRRAEQAQLAAQGYAEAAAASASSVQASAEQIQANANRITDLSDELAVYNSADVIRGLWDRSSPTTSHGVTFTWTEDHFVVTGGSTPPRDSASARNIIGPPAEPLPAGVVPGSQLYLRYSTSDSDVKLRISWYGEGFEKTRAYNSNTIIPVPEEARSWYIRLYIEASATVTEGTEVYLNALLSQRPYSDYAGYIPYLATSYADEIPEYADLDQEPYNAAGTFRCTSLTIARTLLNAPAETTFRLFTFTTTAAARAMQIALVNSIDGSTRIYSRYRSISGGGTWTEWVSYATKSYVDAQVESLSQAMTMREEADPPAVEVFSDLNELAGWWNTDAGGLDSAEEHKHSQLLPIRAGVTYYTGYRESTSNIHGAFFDRNQQYLAPLQSSDFTAYPARRGGVGGYEPPQIVLPLGTLKVDNVITPDPNDSLFPEANYLTFYSFTAPAGAAYLSVNLAPDSMPVPASDAYSDDKTIRRYRSFVCSKPVFIPYGAGNYIIRENDAAYARAKKHKVCVIGPSTLAINRLRRANRSYQGFVNPYAEYKAFAQALTAAGMNPVNARAGYIAGLEEYIKPYFAEVRSLGFSGASMAQNRGSENKCSIYAEICGAVDTFTSGGQTYVYDCTGRAPNLSEYDTFVIFTDSNGAIAADAPAGVDTYTDTLTTTYFGALRAIIAKIRSDNPLAKFILVTASGADPDSLMSRISAQIRKLAAEISAEVWDRELTSGTRDIDSQVFLDYLSYDGRHSNNLGNQRGGMDLRRFMVGI